MGQPWLIDPANAAQRFARSRLRADPGFSPNEPWVQSEAHAVTRHGEDERLAAWLARLARPHRLGFVRIDAAPWGELERVSRTAILGRLLATIGGRAYPVAADKLSRIADDSFDTPVTLGGCIIVRRRDVLLICREPGRIRHRLTLAPGASGQWDGRFAVRHEQGPLAVEIRPLGAEGVQMLGDAARSTLRLAHVPVAVLHGLPAAWAGASLAACPPLERYGLCAEAGFSITAALRPALPLTTASFTGVNVVSNPQQPIYRPSTARVLNGESASAVSSHQPPRPTSRRTQ